MTGNLRQFLFRKKTLALVGVLIVLMVGVGIRLRGNSETDKETIEIVERLLIEEYGGASWTFTKATVTYDGPYRRTVRGLLNLSSIYPEDIKFESEIDLENRSGKWMLRKWHNKIYESYWDRITRYAQSLLP